MGSKKAVLWGIDGELRGNEGRIMSSLPFVSVAKRIAAARSFDWSLEPEQGLRWFSSEAEAEEFGTRLDLEKDLYIAPGQCVVIIGPEFLQSVRQVPGLSLNQESLFVRNSGGFCVAGLPLEDYENLGQNLASESKSAFDQEITFSAGKRLTSRAKAALTVMRGNGFNRLDDVVVRRLIAARITRDADTYRTVRELAVVLLKESADKIDRLAEDHLKILTERVPFQETTALTLLERKLTARFLGLHGLLPVVTRKNRYQPLKIRVGLGNEVRSEGYRKTKALAPRTSEARKE